MRRLVETAAEIMGAPVPTDRDRAFLARQLVQATLPHSDPGDVPVWTRTNGRLTLVVRPYYNHRQRHHLYPYAGAGATVWIASKPSNSGCPRYSGLWPLTS